MGQCSTPRPVVYPRKIASLSIEEDTLWTPRSVWTAVENRNSLASAAFEPQTVQKLGNRNIDYATGSVRIAFTQLN
jgi:hypothetical protein